MKVCLIRNAEAESNSDIIRSIDAFETIGVESVILSRRRETKSKKIEKKTYKYNGKNIDNYEIQLFSEMDKGLKNLLQLIRYQIKVFIWLLKNKSEYDVIHSYDLDAGFPTYMISKILKKKYVYHISDFFVDSRGGIPSFLRKTIKNLEFLVINNAENTIICTEERRNQINGSNPKKLTVIHNSPVSKELNDYRNISNDKLVLSYVGGLIDIRFIEEVIDVVKEKEDVILEIAGIGPLEDKVLEYSQKYSNINFLGRVSYNDALNIYRKSDVMFAIYNPEISNHKLSAPNKVYEAMMFGKPIIVANGTGVDNIVKKENIGYIINYDKNEFADVLEKILRNRNELTKFGENSKNSYKKYSWDTMKKIYGEIYADIENKCVGE